MRVLSESSVVARVARSGALARRFGGIDGGGDCALPTAQNVFVTASQHQVGVMLAREAVLATTILAVPVVLMAAALLA